MTDHIEEFDAPPDLDWVDPPAPPASFSDAARHARWANIERRRIEAITAEFKAEIERLSERLDEVLAPRLSSAQHHETAVEQWHRAAYAAGEVGKTVEFPYATSSLRSPAVEWVVEDEDEFRSWAMLQGLEDVVYPIKEPALSRSALKKVGQPAAKKLEPGSRSPIVDANGETVPGVAAVARSDRHALKGTSND